MTAIIYKKGDLFACTEPWLVHGCNTKGVMGRGVAKTIREKYPEAFEVYLATYKRGDNMLGSVSYTYCHEGKLVFNAVTQDGYGTNKNIIYADYTAIASCFRYINNLVYNTGYYGIGIAMPKIGAGLANGDWNIISKIIEEESTNFQPIVYEL